MMPAMKKPWLIISDIWLLMRRRFPKSGFLGISVVLGARAAALAPKTTPTPKEPKIPGFRQLQEEYNWLVVKITAPVSRKRVGLALGGGIVRGLAHVGVLSTLKEGRIPVDYVSGSSVGAIVAITYCAGWTCEAIERFADKFNWWRMLTLTWPSQGLFSFDRLESWMKREIGDLEFADLKIPCTIVATDIHQGKQVYFSEGPVMPAIHASCAVPGFIKPVVIAGRQYCDGAVVNILPVSVAREMGAEYVIGVDLMAFSMKRALGPLKYLWGAVEILLQNSGGGASSADCLIQPDLAGKTYLRFAKRRELYELGRQAALDNLAKIRAELDLRPGAICADQSRTC